MKIIISPAKSLDFKTALPISKFTEGSFLKESKKINALLKEQSPKELSDLMSISDKLATLNYTRNQDWQLPFTPENARPAIYAFNGDVYTGLDAYSILTAKIDVLQDKLRILSGLYGLLKPLDLIQPYRLEMGTKFPVGSSKNLYEFWRNRLTEALNKEMSSKDILVNLASKEYADAIDFKAIKARVVVPEFKDYKDGKLKVISFYAKKARGQMVRYILDHNCESIEDLKGFNYDKYRFDENLSEDNNLIFTR